MQYDKLFGKDYSICKHLFLHERKGLKRHFLVVVDEDKDVDLKVLKEELEVGKLEFCSSSELEELLHTVPGNVSLFSTKFDTLNQVNIIIDKELLDRLFKDHKKVVTIEDNVITGGFSTNINKFII